jgi:mRNA deadenylase 3'-5' endonuclease subunit Ccr4
VKPEHLAWKRRKHTLLNEIKQLSTAPRADSTSSSSTLADVLCFQELTDYWAFFQRELAQLGYASVYVKRPSLHGTSWSGTHPLSPSLPSPLLTVDHTTRHDQRHDTTHVCA